MIVLQAIIIAAVLALLVLGFLRRDMSRVGGKIGPIRTIDPSQCCRAALHGSMPAR